MLLTVLTWRRVSQPCDRQLKSAVRDGGGSKLCLHLFVRHLLNVAASPVLRQNCISSSLYSSLLPARSILFGSGTCTVFDLCYIPLAFIFF